MSHGPITLAQHRRITSLATRVGANLRTLRRFWQPIGD